MNECVFSSVQESCTSVAWSRTCTAICPNSLHPGTGTKAAWPPWTWMGDSPTWLQMPSTGWVRWNEAATVSDGDQSAAHFHFHFAMFTFHIQIQCCSVTTEGNAQLFCSILQPNSHTDALVWCRGGKNRKMMIIFVEWAEGIKKYWLSVCLLLFISNGNPVCLKYSAAISPSKNLWLFSDNYGQNSWRMGSLSTQL